jgi:Tfp pilus tip-associated adhesin PilY1
MMSSFQAVQSLRGISRVVLATMVVQSIPAPAFAQSTPISPVPLLTAGAERAKPNFLFVMDDSNSMNYEYMPGDPETGDEYKDKHAGTYSSDCNKIYFNPDARVTYAMPPDPAELNFLPYPASRATWDAAPEDGFNASSPKHEMNRKRWGNANGFALLGYGGNKAFYYKFVPESGQVFSESRDCRLEIALSDPAPSVVISETRVSVPSKPDIVTRHGEWRKQDIDSSDRDRFARWFSFYRTRLNVMKSAAALAFSYPTVDERLRIGFVTTTPAADGVNASRATPVADRAFLPIQDFDTTWKRRWLNLLYNLTAKGETPLMLALSRAGWYFAGRTDGPATGMIATGANFDPKTGKATDGSFKDDPVQYSCQRNYALVTTDGYYTNQLPVGLWDRPTPGPGSECKAPYDNCGFGSRDSGTLAEVAAPFNDTVRLWKTERREREVVSVNAQNRSSVSPLTRCDGATVGNPLPGGEHDVSKINVYWLNPATGAYTLAYRHDVSTSDNKVTFDIDMTKMPGGGNPDGFATRLTDFARFQEVWHRYERVESFKVRPHGYSKTFSIGREQILSPPFNWDNPPTNAALDAPNGTLIPISTYIDYSITPYSPLPATIDSFFGVTDMATVGDASRRGGYVFERVFGGGRAKGMDMTWEWFLAERTPPESPARVVNPARIQPRSKNDFFVGCIRAGASCWRGESGRWNCSSGEDSLTKRVNSQPADFNALLGAGTAGRGGVHGNWKGSTGTPLPDVEANRLTDTILDGMWNTDYSLSDTAKYFYETPLRVGKLRGMDFDKSKVPKSGSGPEDDNAEHLHMTTLTMGLGVSGFLDYKPKYKDATLAGNAFNDIRKGFSNDTSKVWPPVYRADAITKVDDLWHAAVNGRGLYLGANNASEVRDRLTDALELIQSRISTGAGASGSSLEPTTSDKQIFWSSFQSGTWTGDLNMQLLETDSTSANFTKLIGTPISASGLVTARAKDSCDDREIWLMKGADTLKDFRWDGKSTRCTPLAAGAPAGRPMAFSGTTVTESAWATIDPTHSKWLAAGSIPIYKTNDTSKDRGPWDLVHWLRGQSSREYGQSNEDLERFRSRSGVNGRNILGDIVGSQPLYVKIAPFGYADPDYSTFKTTTSTRTSMVYVAGNDGMLHAFTPGEANAAATDPTRMQEAWAVIPTMIVPKLGHIAAKDYGGRHQWLIDGSPTAGDVRAGTIAAPAEAWRTIVVTGLAGGGAGYFALDVTNPADPKPLWEIEGPDAAVCADVNDTTTGRHRDCKLGQAFGNPIITKVRASGYDHGRWVVIYASGYNNADGKGYISVRDAGTGVGLHRFELTTTPSAPKEVGVTKIANFVKNALVDNTTEAIYAGDLLGGVWRIDMSGQIGDWGTPTARVSKLAELAAGTPAKAQPITTRPELGVVGGAPIVLIATGRYLDDADTVDKGVQTMYGIIDGGPTTPTITRADLTARSFSTPVTDSAATAAAPAGTSSVTALAATAGSKGWYIDLPIEGERVFADPRLQLGSLVFVSATPSDDPCQPGGKGFVNYVDYRDGSFIAGDSGSTVARVPIAGGMAMGASVFRLPDGTLVNISPTSQPTTPEVTRIAKLVGAIAGRRMTWREVTQ